jgi:hypothetical protein
MRSRPARMTAVAFTGTVAWMFVTTALAQASPATSPDSADPSLTGVEPTSDEPAPAAEPPAGPAVTPPAEGGSAGEETTPPGASPETEVPGAPPDPATSDVPDAEELQPPDEADAAESESESTAASGGESRGQDASAERERALAPDAGVAQTPEDLIGDLVELCPPGLEFCPGLAEEVVLGEEAFAKLVRTCPPALAICQELQEEVANAPPPGPDAMRREFHALLEQCEIDPDFCDFFALILPALRRSIEAVTQGCEVSVAACAVSFCEELGECPETEPGRPTTARRPRSTPPSIAARPLRQHVRVVSTSQTGPQLAETGFPALALALLGLTMSLLGGLLLRAAGPSRRYLR